MLILTEQMKKDLKKIREQDIVVCNYCGSKEVTEKIWVDVNDSITIDGDTYYKYNTEVDDEQYWCEKCYDMTKPIHISEYKGDDDA
tara:strand:- start:572 stop:829 length:258 start_codon:yes stop_codon:yes gene_type:complete